MRAWQAKHVAHPPTHPSRLPLPPPLSVGEAPGSGAGTGGASNRVPAGGLRPRNGGWVGGMQGGVLLTTHVLRAGKQRWRRALLVFVMLACVEPPPTPPSVSWRACTCADVVSSFLPSAPAEGGSGGAAAHCREALAWRKHQHPGERPRWVTARLPERCRCKREHWEKTGVGRLGGKTEVDVTWARFACFQQAGKLHRLPPPRRLCRCRHGAPARLSALRLPR